MIFFQTDELSITAVGNDDTRQILEVYRQSEDFLSLGPVPRASVKMVKDDLERSRNEKGQYCGIRDSHDHLIGIIDFLPMTEERNTAFLSLVMIAVPWRRRGYGKAVVMALEKYLRASYGTQRIKSAVQTNNTDAIRFWRELGYRIATKPEQRPDGTIVYDMTKTLH
jgi:ribosomal protein S18 acetylase RimI-like enzyme